MFSLAISLLPFLLYSGCFNGPFIFDDLLAILWQRTVMGGDWRTAWNGAVWRKIPRVSWALNVKYCGRDMNGNPRMASFHIVNVAIHCINTAMVGATFGVLAGLVFACHPLAVHAVANIASRTSLFAGMFSIVAVLAVVSGYPLLALPFFVLAMLSKEDSIVLPATVAAILMTEGKWLFAMTLLGLCGAVAIRASTHLKELMAGAGDGLHPEPGLPHVMRQPEYSMTTFIDHMLIWIPWSLGFGFSIEHETKPFTAYRYLVAITVVTLVACAFIWFPTVRVGLILWFVAPWLIYVIMPLQDPMMEYRTYLSVAGIAQVLSVALQFIPAPAVAAVIVFFCYRTARRSALWSDEIKLWLSTYEDGSRKARLLLNLGKAYHIRSQTSARVTNDESEARYYYHRVLDRNPRAVGVRCNLAVLEMRKDLPKAARQLQRLVKEFPHHATSWENLGRTFHAMKLYQEAEDAYGNALMVATEGLTPEHLLPPQAATIFASLGELHFEQGRLDAACDDYSDAAEARPDIAEYWRIQGRIRLRQQRFSEAAECFARMVAR